MNLQQLEYIVAVDKFRHFVKASEHCGVSQPTLSMMIRKLEEELDIEIFDRKKHPIQTTEIGKRLVNQAERTLFEMRKMQELVLSEVEMLSGSLHVGLIPTLAPYLVPRLIRNFKENHSKIALTISEMTTETLIGALKKGSIDMFIAATPLKEDEFFEIPLYYERFLAYFSPDHPSIDHSLSSGSMPRENLWILEEGHCLRDQVFNFCVSLMPYNQVFEAGSIDTLIRIVDINGGYSVIPELHREFLTKTQQKNLRKIEAPPAIREISIVIRKNYVKEEMVNVVADCVKSIIPEHMLDERLKKFSIKLF